MIAAQDWEIIRKKIILPVSESLIPFGKTRLSRLNYLFWYTSEESYAWHVHDKMMPDRFLLYNSNETFKKPVRMWYSYFIHC